jgi:hypothetical protein
MPFLLALNFMQNKPEFRCFIPESAVIAKNCEIHKIEDVCVHLQKVGNGKFENCIF